MAKGTLVLGAYQTYTGLKGLKQLEKEGGIPEYGALEEYNVSPELKESYQRAQRMADQGFAPQEKAQFQQGMAQQSALGYRRGTDIAGGGLAGALQAGINASNVGALNQFAASDAALRRKNIQYADTLSSALQSQANLATQARIQQLGERRRRYTELERAYGEALKSGTTNVASAMNASEAEFKQGMGFGGMGNMSSLGMGGGTPPYM